MQRSTPQTKDRQKESSTGIRPEERRGAAAAFLTVFGILAGHTLLETARDALFLARLPASQLPWVYLAMAMIAVPLTQLTGRGPRISASRSVSVLLLGCAAVTLAFWALGSWRSPWTLRALYVWSGIVSTLTLLEFWLVLGEVYTVTQAKRIYRLVGMGSLLGAIAGAGLARAVAASAPPQYLVLSSAMIFALTAVGPALLLRRPAAAATSPLRPGLKSLAGTLQSLGDNPYLKGLAGLVLVSTVALTLADYVFKSAVVRNVPTEQLGSFFAGFYMVLNVLALGAQVLLMGWLLRLLGLHRAQWVLPTLLFAGALGVAFGGGLVAALLLKGADGTLRYSLHRTTTELMFVPIPDRLRARAKPLIDVVGQRGGQALASILILSEAVLGRGDKWLAAASAALCVVWIAWAWDLKGHYLNLFRTALREGSLKRSADVPELDLAALETLFTALNSLDDQEVVAALDLLAEEDRVRLIPALILYHPAQPVVLRALDLFAKSGRTDFLPVADRLLTHGDPELRAAALRARSAVNPDEAVLRRAVDDSSPLVRATALAGLVSGGWIADEGQHTLDELLQSGAPDARIALARAILNQPVPIFEDALLRLSESPEDEVQFHVARAMGAVKSPRFLPALLPMLAQHEVRAAARTALIQHGEEALQFLEEALGDPGLPHEVRRHVPRTISRFPAEQAASVLMNRLTEESDGMVRFKILRGLGRIAAEHPEVSFDRQVVETAVSATLEAAFRLVHWRLTLAAGLIEEPRRATPGHDLLAALLRDKEVHAVERLFRLLGLQVRQENFERIYRGLRNSKPKVRASSRELLENLGVVGRATRLAVLALVDDVPDEQRLLASPPFFVPRRLSYEELLEALLDQSSESLRCIVVYHVAELDLTRLRPRLEAIDRRKVGFYLAQTVEHALAALSAARSETLPHAR